ncbi:MAG: hypothetical protein PHW62_06000 [Candidatus Ratteibacteria bacterium]|nr:hypothetical protein [Candidatus Ratteibacteria bacterium]
MTSIQIAEKYYGRNDTAAKRRCIEKIEKFKGFEEIPWRVKKTQDSHFLERNPGGFRNKFRGGFVVARGGKVPGAPHPFDWVFLYYEEVLVQD